MSSLNLENLKNKRDEVLKAEIGTLLFNLGKTHIGISNWKKYFPNATQLFSSYKDYYKNNHFENELVNVDSRLKDFIFNKKVKLPDNSDIDWKEFFFGDASDKDKDFIKKIFSRGCENINSGIDKGSPEDENQLKELWISNAFGSLKRKPKEDDFDKSRLCFLQNFHRFLEDKNYYNSPRWDKIRGFVLKNIKSRYSRLLSDSRFPVNDVTLWEQAYMTASMFKATLAGLFLDNSKDEKGKSRQEKYIENPQSIKWSILGIQYDKLFLAEKGLKAASIKWYRDIVDEVDYAIKEIIEIDYTLGNEVYRDETGIYFVVSENLIGEKEKEGDFYKLHADLDIIKIKIQAIFSNKFGGEIYPAIFLTKPSRGLMNLGHLVEKAKENFLKVELPDDFKNYLKHDTNPNGICQICGMRLAAKKDKENLVCDVCRKRAKGRVGKWLNKRDKETIWLDELQDKNGRAALVTLKFELGKWINGDLVNSLLVQKKSYQKKLEEIRNFISLFLSNLPLELNPKELEERIKILNDNLEKETDKLRKVSLGKEKSSLNSTKKNIEKIKNIIEAIKKSNWQNKRLKNDIGISSDTGKKLEDIFKKLIRIYNSVKSEYTILSLENISFFPTELSKDAYNGCKNNNESFEDFIRQIFFGSILGNKWEKLVRNHPTSNKIDWNNQTINWQNLTDTDIEFISELILQFLLRKNPSPARLRRIWETTREFFEDLESRIIELAGIEDERQKRLVWDKQNIPDGKYQDGEIIFWAKDGNVYLITSIEKFAQRFKKENLKPMEIYEKIKNHDIDWIKEKEITLKSYGNGNSEEVKLKIHENVFIKEYKPYFTILSPTPISWQFIIPAENIPTLIKKIQEEYHKNFRWVYGKLPLHIGVIIQNYKKPLYVGIKALRNIRRDGQDWLKLGKEISSKEFKARQKGAFHYQQPPEKTEDCENFYSLFEKTTGEGKYEFYLYPDKGKKQKIDVIKEQIDTTQDAIDTDKFYFYQNTFDFEFMDTNTRRNDIYYKDKDTKRFMRLKRNRPYDIEDWQYFEKFEDYFKDKKSSSRLQKLISTIYSKMEDWEDDNKSLKVFMISAFANILDLKSEEKKDGFAKVLGSNDFKELKSLKPKQFIKKLLMLIDMFEFYHTALKFENK